MRPSFKAVTLAVFVTFLLAGHASAADKVVGDTKDACDGHDAVQFEGKTGTVTVKSGQSQTVELPSSTREIHWYCAGTRERSANDTPFNALQITRRSNGAIHWVFLVRTEPAGSGSAGSGSAGSGSAGSGPAGSPAVVQVGNTKDACDSSQVVEVQGTLPTNLKVRAGQIETADLSALTRQIFWNCGKSGERAANSLPFNRVQLERAGNGAMQWVFYRTLSIPGVGLGAFIHDVAGNIIVPVGFTEPPTGVVKTAIDNFWDQNLTEITKVVRSLIPQGRVPGFAGTLKVNNVVLSPSSQLELRVGQSTDTVTVKPVIHGNQVSATLVPDNPKLNVNVTATFDLEMVMLFPRAQTLTVANQMLSGLTMKQPIVLVHHVELEANDPGSNILEGLLKANVRAQETSFNNVMQPANKMITDAILAAINAQLAPLGKGLPPGPAPVTLDADALGEVRVCPKVLGVCRFPAPSGRAVVPRVLGTSNDQCSQQNIWLWDAELGRFVNVARGGSRVVQVDDKRFEWYCGDDSGPDPSPSNEESASGPTSTSQVSVTRDKTGRALHWEFLFWR